MEKALDLALFQFDLKNGDRTDTASPTYFGSPLSSHHFLDPDRGEG
jgi:hypothetical protein